MKKTMKWMTLVLALVLTVSLAACSQLPSSGDSLSEGAVGSILLSVNPEIELAYDAQGYVVNLKGRNQDGEKVLEGYSFTGKTCTQVVEELVAKIYQSGSFELELEGNPRNIVIKLEKGSRDDDDLLEDVAESVRDAVREEGGKSEALVVNSDDQDDEGRIGLEKAKELVLAQLGVSEADFTDKEYELDDGVYELEFTVNGTEYEYEVDAYTGKILEADYENNDDWDDDDDQPLDQTGYIGLEKAKAIAFDHAGVTEADVTERDYDLDDGVYEIEFTAGGVEYEYDIHALTGQILDAQQEKDDDDREDDLNDDRDDDDADDVDDDDDDDDDDRPEDQTGYIGLEKAKAIAFDHAGVTEADVTERDYDLDDGVYEIEFTAGGVEYEYDIHALTGQILDAQQEKDDDR